jgi:hypothetical protein
MVERVRTELNQAPRQPAALVEPLTPPVQDDIASLEISLAIDKLDLDTALEREGDDSFRIAEAYELAISQRDAAKQAVAEAEAIADLAIRRNAEATGSRTTESQVTAMKVLTPAVKEAHRVELDLNLRAGRLRALKDSFDRRSKAISTLASLYASGYFTGAVRQHARDQVQTGAAAAARAELNRRRREEGI